MKKKIDDFYAFKIDQSQTGPVEEPKQKTEADAIALFNESPKKGVALLVQLDVLKESPESVSSYLHECKDLDKV